MSACWSSPPNIYSEDESAISTPESGSAYCWSAPEFLLDEDSDSDGCDYDRKRIIYGRKPESMFANSYPQIETPDPEPSIASIRLPSSDSSSFPTPSPPRPQSPVFGRPPRAEGSGSGSRRIPVSKSLHLHHIRSDFDTHLARCTSPSCQKYANSPPSVSDEDEEEENVAEDEEVWPESEVVYRNQFHGWDDAPVVNRLPRSRSAYQRIPSPPSIPHSRSAYSNLHQRAKRRDFNTHLALCTSPGCQNYVNSPPSESDDEEGEEQENEEHEVEEKDTYWTKRRAIFSNEPDEDSDDDIILNILPRSRSAYQHIPSPPVIPHSRSAYSNLHQMPELRVSTTGSDLHGSAHSQMNNFEMEDYEGRQDWIEKGSTVRLNPDEEVWQLREEFKDFESFKPPNYGLRTFHRSATTDSFRRPPAQTRRRLPRRPDLRNHDAHEDNSGDLPSSISMYGRLLRDESADYSVQYDYTVHSSYRNLASSHSFRSIQNDYHNPPIETVPPVQYRSRQPSEWIRPTHYDDRQMGSSMSSAENDPPIPEQRQGRPPDLPLRSSLVTQQSQGSVRSPLAVIPRKDNPYSELETPMSPPVHILPSPALSTGRRLPALPVRNSILDSLPTMSQINQPTHSGHMTKEDHRLCFGMESLMGRSALEDSYYEEDGMNGNNNYGGGRRMRKSFFSPDDSSGVSSCTGSESLNPTHRVQSAFVPRHGDEVLLDIGDAVHVDRTCEDHWNYGTNLRTGQHGIFPSSVVCEIDLVEEICMGALPTNAQKILSEERDTFYLTLLASIEVGHHKGNDVLVQAINKVLSMYKNKEEIIVPQTVLMEISFRGIHVIDKRKKNFFQCPTFDFFYSLQNISFCGAHPKQLKYFAFITKHPLLPRFACHVFLSNESTQPIVESIGRAFKRSYDEYMAFAHPTEDIYLE